VSPGDGIDLVNDLGGLRDKVVLLHGPGRIATGNCMLDSPSIEVWVSCPE
jgi:hypothetical protein